MKNLVYAFTYHSNGTVTTNIVAHNMLEAFMKFREHKDGQVYTLLKIELTGEALSDL
jgi:hypothetical protein